MPSITIWDRIEPRCRENDPTPGLGGAGARSSLAARATVAGRRVRGSRCGLPRGRERPIFRRGVGMVICRGSAAETYDGSQPIEALVERERARPASGVPDLRQAAEAGLYFLRLLMP